MSGHIYKLKDDGYPTFKKIIRGNKWIGRVCATQLGHYLGIIGKTTVKAPTEDQAFREVVAQHCGHGNYEIMAAKNRAVRAANKRRKAEVNMVLSEIISGNFEPFAKLLEKTDKEFGQ